MDADGLVKDTISARSLSPSPHGGAVVMVRPAGLAVKAHTQGPTVRRDAMPPRGEVRGFSSRSRKRMLQKLSGLAWDSMPVLFVTLTYHVDWGTAYDWHADLRAWQMRLMRRWGHCLAGAVWKLEFQRRGAPHWHICVFWQGGGDVPLHDLRVWCSQSWNAIVAPGDDKHAKAGTQVKQAHSTSGSGLSRLMQYLGKYLAKTGRLVDTDTGEVMVTGRIWGIWGALPTGETVSYTLTQEAFTQLCRRVRRWGKASARLARVTPKWKGYLILADGALVGQLLRGIEGVACQS